LPLEQVNKIATESGQVKEMDKLKIRAESK